ncbi:hypothetical protein NQ314_001835 [Rhamnusium bicolor]|uniref:Galectin domain-containing protein n=1 Tax=Rhamnusium bicolor TaxID=1586634 RepID=A0AAV8ZTB4_9CUCU|nr:hypothetical protein NQ314_001835 [Rhamnusium bicolor]
MEVGVEALCCDIDICDSFVNVDQTDVPPPSFVEDLPNDVGPGSCISIHGFVQPQCSRFV